MIKIQIKIQTRRLRARAHTHTHTGTHTQVPHARTSTVARTHTLAHARMLARAHTRSIYTVCVCIDSVSKMLYQLKHCQYLVSVHDHCVVFSNTVLCDLQTHAHTHTPELRNAFLNSTSSEVLNSEPYCLLACSVSVHKYVLSLIFTAVVSRHPLAPK